jgi:hypothetical protein
MVCYQRGIWLTWPGTWARKFESLRVWDGRQDGQNQSDQLISLRWEQPERKRNPADRQRMKPADRSQVGPADYQKERPAAPARGETSCIAEGKKGREETQTNFYPCWPLLGQQHLYTLNPRLTEIKGVPVPIMKSPWCSGENLDLTVGGGGGGRPAQVNRNVKYAETA